MRSTERLLCAAVVSAVAGSGVAWAQIGNIPGFAYGDNLNGINDDQTFDGYPNTPGKYIRHQGLSSTDSGDDGVPNSLDDTWGNARPLSTSDASPASPGNIGSQVNHFNSAMGDPGVRFAPEIAYASNAVGVIDNATLLADGGYNATRTATVNSWTNWTAQGAGQAGGRHIHKDGPDPAGAMGGFIVAPQGSVAPLHNHINAYGWTTADTDLGFGAPGAQDAIYWGTLRSGKGPLVVADPAADNGSMVAMVDVYMEGLDNGFLMSVTSSLLGETAGEGIGATFAVGAFSMDFEGTDRLATPVIITIDDPDNPGREIQLSPQPSYYPNWGVAILVSGDGRAEPQDKLRSRGGFGVYDDADKKPMFWQTKKPISLMEWTTLAIRFSKSGTATVWVKDSTTIGKSIQGPLATQYAGEVFEKDYAQIFPGMKGGASDGLGFSGDEFEGWPASYDRENDDLTELDPNIYTDFLDGGFTYGGNAFTLDGETELQLPSSMDNIKLDLRHGWETRDGLLGPTPAMVRGFTGHNIYFDNFRMNGLAFEPAVLRDGRLPYCEDVEAWGDGGIVEFLAFNDRTRVAARTDTGNTMFISSKANQGGASGKSFKHTNTGVGAEEPGTGAWIMEYMQPETAFAAPGKLAEFQVWYRQAVGNRHHAFRIVPGAHQGIPAFTTPYWNQALISDALTKQPSFDMSLGVFDKTLDSPAVVDRIHLWQRNPEFNETLRVTDPDDLVDTADDITVKYGHAPGTNRMYTEVPLKYKDDNSAATVPLNTWYRIRVTFDEPDPILAGGDTLSTGSVAKVYMLIEGQGERELVADDAATVFPEGSFDELRVLSSAMSGVIFYNGASTDSDALGQDLFIDNIKFDGTPGNLLCGVNAPTTSTVASAQASFTLPYSEGFDGYVKSVHAGRSGYIPVLQTRDDESRSANPIVRASADYEFNGYMFDEISYDGVASGATDSVYLYTFNSASYWNTSVLGTRPAIGTQFAVRDLISGLPTDTGDTVEPGLAIGAPFVLLDSADGQVLAEGNWSLANGGSPVELSKADPGTVDLGLEIRPCYALRSESIDGHQGFITGAAHIYAGSAYQQYVDLDEGGSLNRVYQETHGFDRQFDGLGQVGFPRNAVADDPVVDQRLTSLELNGSPTAAPVHRWRVPSTTPSKKLATEICFDVKIPTTSFFGWTVPRTNTAISVSHDEISFYDSSVLGKSPAIEHIVCSVHFGGPWRQSALGPAPDFIDPNLNQPFPAVPFGTFSVLERNPGFDPVAHADPDQNTVLPHYALNNPVALHNAEAGVKVPMDQWFRVRMTIKGADGESDDWKIEVNTSDDLDNDANFAELGSGGAVYPRTPAQKLAGDFQIGSIRHDVVAFNEADAGTTTTLDITVNVQAPDFDASHADYGPDVNGPTVSPSLLYEACGVPLYYDDGTGIINDGLVLPATGKKLPLVTSIRDDGAGAAVIHDVDAAEGNPDGEPDTPRPFGDLTEWVEDFGTDNVAQSRDWLMLTKTNLPPDVAALLNAPGGIEFTVNLADKVDPNVGGSFVSTKKDAFAYSETFFDTPGGDPSVLGDVVPPGVDEPDAAGKILPPYSENVNVNNGFNFEQTPRPYYNAILFAEYRDSSTAISKIDPPQFLLDNIKVDTVAKTCPADINGDGVVDGVDLAQMLGAWRSSGNVADINGDGIVDGVDLAQMLGAWGACDS